MNRRLVLIGGLAVASVLTALAAESGNLKGVQFTDEFPLDECAGFATSTDEGARNRYFPLEVNRVLELSNAGCDDCDELEEVRITILDETQEIDGITTRVVEEREWVDDELVEVSRNFMAECLGSEDVFYFGEDVLDGEGNPLPDGWRAGVNGARAGLFIAGGSFLLGARYFQEVAPGAALDRADHRAMGLTFDENGFEFEHCVLIVDTNFLSDPKGKEPGDEKIYCPGIGLVMDEELALVNIVFP